MYVYTMIYELTRCLLSSCVLLCPLALLLSLERLALHLQRETMNKIKKKSLFEEKEKEIDKNTPVEYAANYTARTRPNHSKVKCCAASIHSMPFASEEIDAFIAGGWDG